jgi:hypothetical protein
MSLLTVVRDVCAVVGVELPTSVFTSISANRTMQEMVALANEMAQRIAFDTREWTRLRKTHIFAGTGVLGVDGFVTGTGEFDLPADYQRMLLSSNVWHSSYTQSPMRFIANPDEWVKRRISNTVEGRGEWTLLNGQMVIRPIMLVGQEAMFAYLHRNCIKLAAGGFGSSFLADDDSFVLSERVLRLGMIWQWKAQKGSAYAEDMGTYGDALNVASGADSPAPILVDRPVFGGGNALY